MKRLPAILGTVLLLSLSYILAAAFDVDAQGPKINPTQQYQTIQAVIQQYFQQTATASSRAIASPTPNPQTATAEFERLVQDSFSQALTATADTQQVAAYAIQGQIATNQNVNVRGCPSTSCPIVGVLSPTASFLVLLQEGDWYLIQFEDSQLGYLYAPLAKLPPDADLSALPTLTPSPSPSPTATATNTPLPPTPTPNLAMTATIEALGPLVEPKGDGFYLVGVDIAPGKWESEAGMSDCYWERLDRLGDIIDNDYSFSGGTVTVLPQDYEVHFEECGIFRYVEFQEKVLAPTAYESKDDGFYTVGIEIAPGRWRSTGLGGDCYWERRNAFQDIIDNHFGNAGGTIYINSNDYEVYFDDCGIWEYLSP